MPPVPSSTVTRQNQRPPRPRSGEIEEPRSGSNAPSTRRTGLVRRLALEKLREFRRAGMSYREIGRRYAAPPGAARQGEGSFELRLPPERLLRIDRSARAGGGQRNADAAAFLRALDALEQGLAFFDCAGTLLHANRAFSRALQTGTEGKRLRTEVQLFADAMCRLVRVRVLEEEKGCVEQLAWREVPLAGEHLRLRASYIGLDLFGHGASVLVTLERPAEDSLSDEVLRARFGLSRQESRITRHLVEGRTNVEIAGRLFLSPHTVRRHIEHIFRKLGVRSRSQVGLRVLRGGASSRSPPSAVGEHPAER